MFRKEAIDVDDDGRERENLLDKEAKKSGHHPKLSRVESVEIMENYVFIMGQGKRVKSGVELRGLAQKAINEWVKFLVVLSRF